MRFWLLLIALSAPLFAHAAASETEILAEINRARENPPAYAEKMERARAWFRADRILARPGARAIQTHEGVSALDEAVSVLRRALPVPRLERSAQLTRAADYLAARQSKTGSTGHEPLDRLGAWSASGEVISYGVATAQEIVFDLLVDDNRPDRGHRHNLLNPAFRHLGASVASHPRFRSVCVIDLAGVKM